jgi:hypothetical protein
MPSFLLIAPKISDILLVFFLKKIKIKIKKKKEQA